MSLISQYRTFKAHLDGYTEIPFDEFRHKILPLRKKRIEWSESETEYVRDLVIRGAGVALQKFYGRRHNASEAALGGIEMLPEDMTKAELDSHMTNLIRNCLRAGWSSERFLSFIVYLDSDMTPAALVEQDRERRRLLALSSPASVKNVDADDWDDGAAPERDLFAEKYRAAGSVFKDAVREHLARASNEELRRSSLLKNNAATRAKNDDDE